MNQASVHGLIRRRGNVLQWLHAIAPNAEDIDPFTGGPKVGPGFDTQATGPYGETYHRPVPVRAYLSAKAASVTFQNFGNIEVGDLQLDLAVPYQSEPGWDAILPELLHEFNEGNFARIFRTPLEEAVTQQETMCFDRFVIVGKTYVAKARPVPIVDQDKVLAWRLLVGRVSV